MYSSFNIFENKLPFLLRDYKFIKLLGKGTFSSAFEVTNDQYNSSLCAKIAIIDQSVVAHDGSILDPELYALLSFNHPNIVKLFDFFVIDNYVFYIIELCENGTVQDEILKNGPMKIGRAKEIFYGIVSALIECQRNNIAHRDIKPSNIFLSQEGKPKLGDFGLSTVLHKGKFVNNACGSLHYFAPEVISGNPFCPYMSDVYSLGVTLYYMLTGKLPDSKNSLTFPSGFNVDAKDLIIRMIDLDPHKRPYLEEIRQHSFLKVKPKGCGSGNFPPCYLSYKAPIHKDRISEAKSEKSLNLAGRTLILNKKRNYSNRIPYRVSSYN